MVSLLLVPAAARGEDLQPLFSSGFEGGNLFEWWNGATGGGDLSVSAAAAIAGSYGLQAIVDDGDALYVEDAVARHYPVQPEGESYYHVSFRFDPNGFDPGEGRGVLRTRIFVALQDAPVRRVLTLVLRRRNEQFALMARVRLDDNREALTPFVAITDEAHLIEFAWYRATSAARNGSFRLSIDGAVVSTLAGLDNGQSAIDFTRLGALSVSGGASGTLYWDDYRTFRDEAAARAQLVINEVDYDQPGADTQEFVEIYNPGPAPVVHSGDDVWAIFLDGATHFVVGGYSDPSRLAAGQYLVFASPTVAVAPGAIRRNFILNQDSLGNGAPDGIVLVRRSGTTAGCEVLDAISYEGPMSAPLAPDCGIIDLVEGTALPAHIEDSDVMPGSLVRLPNGSDTNDASTDWILSSTPTPGAPNVP